MPREAWFQFSNLTRNIGPREASKPCRSFDEFYELPSISTFWGYSDVDGLEESIIFDDEVVSTKNSMKTITNIHEGMLHRGSSLLEPERQLRFETIENAYRR
ncbi:hypothetical protein BT63DRAFT_456461 [Microthyrium microscopicum]|uniref:Uncharacterized protein n=1 Tax=Microthyrium microscopicum TaxID=703497 RepID=A0A6A6UBI8_9PEZI|nr:hypothetical protein BT63DRAFT_456461 [Microthyrium microscopicum]